MKIETKNDNQLKNPTINSKIPDSLVGIVAWLEKEISSFLSVATLLNLSVAKYIDGMKIKIPNMRSATARLILYRCCGFFLLVLIKNKYNAMELTAVVAKPDIK